MICFASLTCSVCGETIQEAVFDFVNGAVVLLPCRCASPEEAA